MSDDLYTRMSKSFAAFADKPFIEEAARRWTYGEVERATGRLAAHLQALGLKPGMEIGPPCAIAVFCWFSV